MNILVTGASGFIGSYIVEEALGRGMEVWAGVRPTSSRRYLSDPRIHFIDLDLDSPAQLARALAGLRLDYAVHAAGATKCVDKADFHRINAEGTAHLAEALAATQPALRRLVFLSSLSVMGAPRERQPYTDIAPTDTPQPNTAYGRSKLEAEQALAALRTADGQGLPYVVLRPTGVYGPRERDYFTQVQSIARHIDFAVGHRPQDITFVYVLDVVQAVFLALERGQVGRSYFLSDGGVYRSATFSDLVWQQLGRPWRLRLTAPLWLLRLITQCGEWAGRLTGRPIVLNTDKYHILSQRNWQCDIGPAERELGYRPQVLLPEGVRRAVKWYRENGWL